MTLYFANDRYLDLKPTDVIGLPRASGSGGEKLFLRVTNVRIVDGKDLQGSSEDYPPLKQSVESQIGRTLKAEDRIQIVEGITIYEWQIEQNRPVV